MNITFNELREIKHKLPTGSVRKIADQLNIPEQTVRSYFGASKFGEGNTSGNHWQPGPEGGIVSIEDASILEAARQILREMPNAPKA
jgi:hypothetical protein